MSQSSGRERTRPRLRLGRGWPDSTWRPRARVSRAQSRRPGLWFCGSSASPAEPARGAASRSRERTCGAEVATARVGQAKGTGWPTAGPAPVQVGVTEGPGRQNRYPDPAGHWTASQDGGRLLAPPRGVERPGLVHAFKKRPPPAAGRRRGADPAVPPRHPQQPLRPTARLVQPELQLPLWRYFRDCHDSWGTISALLGCL